MIEARGSPKALARAYSLASRLYESTAARLEREAVSRGLVRAGVRPGERILEVGVGPGHIHERLLRRVGSGLLVGVDLAPGMLRATHRRVPAARLARADARRLPFPEETFDLLWSSYLLDLIPTEEMTPLLAEFRRVLKPRGRAVLVNFSKNHPGLTWWERLYQWTPTWLVPYVFFGCRPVQAEPFARAAGFLKVEREFVPCGLDSEIIAAKK